MMKNENKEQLLLLTYVSLLSSFIFFAPKNDIHAQSLRPLVDWIPAARSLIELSNFPTKTTLWFVATFALLPVTIMYSALRTSKLVRANKEEIIASLKSLVIISFLLTPFLLISDYKIGMKKYGSIISALSKSELQLIVFGTTASITYSLVYSMLIATIFRLMTQKNHLTTN